MPGGDSIGWRIALGVLLVLVLIGAVAGVVWGRAVPLALVLVIAAVLVGLGVWAGWIDACICRPIGWGGGIGSAYLVSVGGVDVYPLVPPLVEAVGLGVGVAGLVGVLGYGVGTAVRRVQEHDAS